MPSLILFLFWQRCISLLGFQSTYNLEENLCKFVDVERLLKLIPLATKAAIAKLDLLRSLFLFPQYIALFSCIFIMSIFPRFLIKSERRVLKSLLVFPIYNTLIAFALMLAYFSDTHVVVPTRYLSHTIPIVYFVLGVLALRFYQSKNVSIPIITRRLMLIAVLVLAFLNSIALGGAYSHLPNDINDYTQYLAGVVKSKYPGNYNVQFIAQKDSYYTVRNYWNYYAIPEISTISPSSIGSGKEINASIIRDTSIQTHQQYIDFLRDNNVGVILVYESDSEYNKLSKLDLKYDKVYLLNFGGKEDNLNILWSEQRLSIDIYRKHVFRNAVKAFWEDVNANIDKIWKRNENSWSTHRT